ncbi:MAG: site-specific integrase [Actinomycetota bacterium]|nr:site-specific integrase [Actinomycetota bacterium]
MGKKRRRSAGEGSVGWQPKLGVYRARLYIPKRYRHLHGGKTHLSFYAKREADAIAKRDAAREAMQESRKGRETPFGLYLSRWLETLDALGSVSERTLQDYRRHTEKHLIPGIGAVLISDLTAEDLDHLYAKLASDGVGVRTINHVHAAARVALQRAVKKRLIPFNPARDADPPRYSTDEREYDVLSWEGVRAFLSAAQGDRFEALWTVAVLSGMRPAEIRALKWEDLALPDRGEGEARVRRSVVELAGEPPKIRNTTKTKKGRSVPLHPASVAALVSHKGRQNAERMAARSWKDPGLVFATTTGTVVSRSNLTRRHFKPILERAGLPKETRLYDLRHTMATLWTEGGEDGTLLQKVMGHARYETTANRYIHPSDHAMNEAMKRFGENL